MKQFLVVDDSGEGPPSLLLSWEELDRVNDPETMNELDLLEVGEETIVGMCDPVRRVEDATDSCRPDPAGGATTDRSGQRGDR